MEGTAATAGMVAAVTAGTAGMEAAAGMVGTIAMPATLTRPPRARAGMGMGTAGTAGMEAAAALPALALVLPALVPALVLPALVRAPARPIPAPGMAAGAPARPIPAVILMVDGRTLTTAACGIRSVALASCAFSGWVNGNAPTRPACRPGGTRRPIIERGKAMTDRPMNELGDAPIEEAFREKMQAIAEVLDSFLNGEDKGQARKTGFVLLLFPYNDTGRCNFISNGADRRDVVVLMREMIRRFEGAPDVTGEA